MSSSHSFGPQGQVTYYTDAINFNVSLIFRLMEVVISYKTHLLRDAVNGAMWHKASCGHLTVTETMETKVHAGPLGTRTLKLSPYPKSDLISCIKRSYYINCGSRYM